MTPTAIDRGFVRLADGLIHYRRATGADIDVRPPLVLIHGGPGSSADLVPLMTALLADRDVIAPDLMGMGESDPAPSDRSGIADHAERIRVMLDQLGVDSIDLYGHHSGAQVACEIAIAHPHRVRRLVLDGVGLFSDAQKEEFLERYAPSVAPDADGEHLRALWTFVRNTTVYFPHYAETEKGRIAGGVARPPQVLTDKVADVLKRWRTYHLLYQSAFRHDLRGRLSLIQAQTLVLEVAGDPLAGYASDAVSLVPDAERQATAPAPAARAAVIAAFLDA